MRSIVGVIRVRGRLRMGGAGDKEVIDSLNHRCRVAFLGAPSPGARALHARTPTSPRARGEVRETPPYANIFPGQPCLDREDRQHGIANEFQDLAAALGDRIAHRAEVTIEQIDQRLFSIVAELVGPVR